MDKKRDKTSTKHIIHIKRVLKSRMKELSIEGKSLRFMELHEKYLELR